MYKYINKAYICFKSTQCQLTEHTAPTKGNLSDGRVGIMVLNSGSDKKIKK